METFIKLLLVPSPESIPASRTAQYRPATLMIKTKTTHETVPAQFR